MSRTGIEVSHERGGPIYRQIVDQLARRIRSGVYPPEYRLPTTRDLSAELGVHRNTVVRAFDELARRKLVYTIVGSGTYVSKPPAPAPAIQPVDAEPITWNALTSDASRAEPLARYQRLSRNVGEGDYINLARLHPSADLLPAEELRLCTSEVLRSVGQEALGYASAGGLTRLRNTLARHLWDRGIPARADDLVITTGSQQALDLVARVLVDPGDAVLMEAHSYPGAINAFSAAGARLLAVDWDADGPELSTLRHLSTSAAKALYLMPNGANPTGKRISEPRRREIVAWSASSGIPLIEDDYAAGLDADPPPVAMRSLNRDVIHIGTFSKNLAPALRVGYIICPEGLAGRITAMKQAMDLGTSLLLQHVLAEFLERGYLQSHLENVQQAYARRRQALAEVLHHHMPAEIPVRVPDSGVVIWIDLPGWIDQERLFNEAIRQGVIVSPGTFHAVDPHAGHGIRLTFCGESIERVREGGRRLAAACTELLSASRDMQTQAPSIDGV